MNTTTIYKIQPLEKISQEYPVILSETHDGKRSNRYVTVPTIDIIKSMEENNWGIRQVMAPKSRKTDPNFSKHIVRFAPKNPDFTLPDPRGYSHGLIPEIVILNSLNGTSRISICAGLLALICTNGLMATIENFGKWSHQHMGFNAQDAFRIIGEYRNNIERVGEVITRMAAITLTQEQRIEFARLSAVYRFPNNLEEIRNDTFKYQQLLQPRRSQDKGNDLWTTYNVIQENTMQGGQRLGSRMSRALNNIDSVQQVNDDIWGLATAYLN